RAARRCCWARRVSSRRCGPGRATRRWAETLVVFAATTTRPVRARCGAFAGVRGRRAVAGAQGVRRVLAHTADAGRLPAHATVGRLPARAAVARLPATQHSSPAFSRLLDCR